jgi:hypothetical protein
VLRIVGWDSTPGLAVDQRRGPAGAPETDRQGSMAR